MCALYAPFVITFIRVNESDTVEENVLPCVAMKMTWMTHNGRSCSSVA